MATFETSHRPGPSTRTWVAEWRDSTVTRHEDRLTTEEPLEIRIDSPGAPDRRFGVTMRTPGHDFELAAGLVLGEGVIAGLDDVRSIAYCTDATLTPEQAFNVVTVHLNLAPRADWVDRQMTATSACGVCGTDSLDAVAVDRVPGAAAHVARHYEVGILTSLPDRLREKQVVFERTGGIHAAGLFTAAGAPIVVREDVGRHNAVDKAVGHCLLGDIDTRDAVLCTSGRLGFEIVQKATVAGVGAVVAVGAPTSLAIRLAERYEMTVLGFVRATRAVIYAGAGSLDVSSPIPGESGAE